MAFDLHFVEERIGLSSCPGSPDDVDELPFDTIVNVCHFEKPPYLDDGPGGKTIVQWPFQDSLLAPGLPLRAAVLELAHAWRNGKNVLVHCQEGRSRSPTVIALFLMARDGLSWSAAVDRLSRIGLVSISIPS